MKSFDDFLNYLDTNKTDYFDLLSISEYKIPFPTNNDELKEFVETIGKLNFNQTINLLKMYHDWLGK